VGEADGVVDGVADGEDLTVGESVLFQRGIQCCAGHHFQLAADYRISAQSY
jgi:hypothetical protein